METKVKFGEVLSATIRVDNSSDTDRIFAISGDASVSSSHVTSVYNGSVTPMGEDAGLWACSFSRDDHSYSFSFTGQTSAEKKAAVVVALTDFLDSVKACRISVSVE